MSTAVDGGDEHPDGSGTAPAGNVHEDPEASPEIPSEPLSIGEVLSVLAEEFPDITISKIRFLESQGLVQPERNASGYRQFGDADIERLRWILRQQRDHYLPLKVIRRALERGVDVIDAGAGDQPTLWTAVADAAAREEVASQKEAIARDEAAEARRSAARSGSHPARRSEQSVPRGAEPARPRHSSPADVVAALQEDPREVPAAPQPSPDATDSDEASGNGASGDGAEAAVNGPGTVAVPKAPPVAGPIPDGGDMRELPRDELLSEVGLADETLDDLVDYGLVSPAVVAGEQLFDQVDLAVARLARRGVELGMSPRHLRMYLVAAVREAGLLEQLAMPLLKQRNPDAKARAVGTVEELAGLGAELHALLLGRELGPNLRA
ncbi:MAG: MerR family transcriptional regulator [Microthrixaceae bacterium]|nr:MerR family transcriptional regulator [Microthrixaceae bacterium]